MARLNLIKHSLFYDVCPLRLHLRLRHRFFSACYSFALFTSDCRVSFGEKNGWSWTSPFLYTWDSDMDIIVNRLFLFRQLCILRMDLVKGLYRRVLLMLIKIDSYLLLVNWLRLWLMLLLKATINNSRLALKLVEMI